jgi:acyl-CoA hydrolase
MMSRKEYTRAAEIIRFAKPEHRDSLINAFIDFFKGDNPRFDSDRFKDACQPKATKPRG